MKTAFTISTLQKSACAARNPHLATPQESHKIPQDTHKVKNKYGNVPQYFDGKYFQSTKERDRYITLRMLENSGLIKNLQCQVEFILEVEGKKVCSYFADFTYEAVIGGKMVVEDTKSKATRRLAVYRLKKKLMHACYGITIKEV
jgi:hypothetical protein